MVDSVRVRLTLWYSLFLAFALVLLALITYWVVKRSIRERTDASVNELADSFLVTLYDELGDSANDLAGAARQAMLEHRYPDHGFAVFDSKGVLLGSSTDLPVPEARGHAFEHLSSASIQACGQTMERLDRAFRNVRGVRCYARQFTAAGNAYVLVIAASLHAERETLEQIQVAFAWLIPLTLGLAASGGYFMARASLAPVVAMGKQADRIGATNLHERLPVHNPADELGGLAATFNRLLDRLTESFERQRRFIADASHELRTPVAILRGEAEVALSKPARSTADYRESLAILQLEAKRLTHIVEDLFTLTRADSGQYPLSFCEFYLDDLVTDCVHSVRSLALANNVTLTAAPTGELPIYADQPLIRRMLLNLLDNAIKYTPEGGQVTVSAKACSCGVEVAVADTGPGIPAELQPRVFDRFFRADPVRSRTSPNGGAGLGLSIARWIAEAHDGQLDLTRSDASGSVFTAFLPTRPVSAAKSD